MNSNNFFIQEYLSSLKESNELDYLFPLLLKNMGYRIIRTPKEAIGQNQYGKDVIAIGKDQKGTLHKWYFEIKGFDDKDINEANFHKKDGILESLREAKFVNYEDFSIPILQELPPKIVLVHNGILKPNFLPTFNGFIVKELDGYNFERWDIFKLSDLFTEYLFGEYLFTDLDSNLLLKKTFAFWDLEDYDFLHFKQLVILQFQNKGKSSERRPLKKLFATLGLLNALILHYSKIDNNLLPAKECSKFLIIKTWEWILKNNLEQRKAVIKEFRKLLHGQFEIFDTYFRKTFKIATIQNGLYSENGVFFEKIGYPIRCFEYLDDIIHYCRLRHCIFRTTNKSKIINKQKDCIIELIQKNSGFERPILDNHSITLLQLFLFFSDQESLRKEDVEFMYNYVFQVVQNLKIQKIRHDIQPELHNNIDLVIEASATGIKPNEYCDSSSILLAILLELSVVFNSEELLKEILSFIDEKLSLQIVSIDFENHNVEHLLFEKNLHNEYYVDCIDRVQDGLKLLKTEGNFEEFKKILNEKKEAPPDFITDKKGFACVRYLAHSYFKNEILPFEWRQLIKDDK